MARFANVIVDISHEKLDKTFVYAIPEEIENQIKPGVRVDIPFGARTMTGYVIELSDQTDFDESKIKPLIGICSGSVAVESKLIELAAWIRKNYGSTMNQALKTVIPVKKETKAISHRRVVLNVSTPEARQKLCLMEEKHRTAQARLLRELIEQKELEYSLVTSKLGVASVTIKTLEKAGLLRIDEETRYRNPVQHLESGEYNITLNQSQQRVVDRITSDIDGGINKTYLIKGVTGSGKTEVYMELIAHVLEQGRKAIVLIPEIALTYQTVKRFLNRFGQRVSIMNSRMTPAEKYDQLQRAKAGEIDIMIGPRSALFTPFDNLGLIIIDEEHEGSYKSEAVPRYHIREVAIEYAGLNGASVVLGSATPSIDSYYKAMEGEYELLELNDRVNKKPLPNCEIIDLRAELKAGNRSILSNRLAELMTDRLNKKEQIMLFINRRGMSGFMSCRACGYVVKCPHCDVSLSQHNNGRMVCHYCGYEEAVPTVCPSCGSKYISGFKAGTQKIEMLVQKQFPSARILRMDYDTTRTKDSYETILSAFSSGEADILIGTQMIVKGHDFPNVTLVGILAADMSLHVADFHSAERTFQLITQGAGRAGRGNIPGDVIIQTYDPAHYAIAAAQQQNYEEFYDREIEYRHMMNYPPVWNMLLILCSSKNEDECQQAVDFVSSNIDVYINENAPGKVAAIGPADATISRVNDVYRKVIYLKTAKYDTLVDIKDALEGIIKDNILFKNISVQFDFNPVNGF